MPSDKEEIRKNIVQYASSLEDRTVALKVKLDIINKLLEYTKGHDLKDVYPPSAAAGVGGGGSVETFLRSMRGMIVSTSRTIRAASLRLVRYIMKAPIVMGYVIALNMAPFISRSFERDKHSEAERVQALKLIRAMSEVDAPRMPLCCVQALVAVAEAQDDSFCRVALETICEISVRSPHVCSLGGGLRTMFDAALDPMFQGMQESLLAAVGYLLNENETRAYIRPGVDLQTILAPFTNSYLLGPLPKGTNKDKEKEKEKEDEVLTKRWHGACKAVITLLKTWPGIISLASDAQGLKSIVNALYLPHSELHDKLIDALFEILRVSQPKTADPFRISSHYTVAGKAATGKPGEGSGLTLELPSRTRSARHNLLNNYISILLVAFIDCGLIEGLAHIGNVSFPTTTDEAEKIRFKNISQKATILLGEILHLSNTLLPSAQCARVQTLPALVNLSISFQDDPRSRSRASTMVTHLHSYSHIKATSSFADFYLGLIVTGANKWRRIKGKDRRLDKIDDVKMKMDRAMEDNVFQARLKDSNVLTTKDIQKWNWDAISELLSGPLNNPTHLTSALKTKFIKRILSFLRPSNRLFCNMAWTTENMKYARIACQTMEVLVNADAGFEYLKDNKMITHISDMLRQEIELAYAEAEELRRLQTRDPSSPSLSGHGDHGTRSRKGSVSTEKRLLSQEKVLKTMAREYFTLLGTLSSTTYGLAIMARNKIFDYLKPMSELPGRDDLSDLIMRSLDYNVAGESRVILAKALTSSSTVVRFLATRHMKVLLRAGVQQYNDWGVDLLVNQLNDPDPKVGLVALSVLDEACDDIVCMEALIRLRPSLLKHGKPGKSLMLRFLSRSSGIKYLSEIGFVAQEMAFWVKEENVQYVLSLESNLSELLNPSIWKQREGSDQANAGAYLPPHLFGELAKTEEGCELLKQSGLFEVFMGIIRRASRATTTSSSSSSSTTTSSSSSSSITKTSSSSNNAIPNNNNNNSNSGANGSSKSSSDVSTVAVVGADNVHSSLETRAALYAVGHIGSSPTGFSFLEDDGSVPLILSLAQSSSNLSLRGTCFFVLGMISQIERAREILDKLGWESPQNLHSYITVPKDISQDSFLKVAPYEYLGSWAGSSPSMVSFDSLGFPPAHKEILEYVAKLSNHITADTASRNLKRLKTKQPELFLCNPAAATPAATPGGAPAAPTTSIPPSPSESSAGLLYQTLQLMGIYKYRLGVRRFIFDCVDSAILSDDMFPLLDLEPRNQPPNAAAGAAARPPASPSIGATAASATTPPTSTNPSVSSTSTSTSTSASSSSTSTSASSSSATATDSSSTANAGTVPTA